MIDGGRSPTTREMPDRVTGAALFADISGFTPLTEALAAELGSQRGAEELTANLGRVFHAVIDELDRRGGDVIYFAGDAITCWLDGDDGTRATAAALAMQDAMAREGTIHTPGGTTVQLALKVAVATGAARRFVVGDPDIQLIDVLAGTLIDDLAEAEHDAEKGEVVLDPSAIARPGRPGPHRANAGSIRRPVAPSGSSTSSSSPSRRSRSWNRRPSTRRWSGRGCCRRSTSACATAAASCWRSSARPTRCSCASRGIDYDDDPDADRGARRLRAGRRSGSWPATAATSCS